MKNPIPSIENDFVVMSPDKNVSIERFDSTMYERLDETYNGFKGYELISCHEFVSDWPSWELHPFGDEIVILLSGSATFLLKLASCEESIVLDQQGQYVVVPKGTWHTAKIRKCAKMLFITPGEGTENQYI